MVVVTGIVAGLHLVAVAFAASGPLLAAWCDLARKRRELADHAGCWIAGHAVGGLLVGSGLGLLLGYLQWSDGFRVSLRALRAKLEWGGAEWLFSLVLLVIVARWWNRRPDLPRGKRWVRAILSLLAGTNLLYHFSFLFFVLERLERLGVVDPVDAARFRTFMADPSIFVPALHFVLATLVVCGVGWICAAGGLCRAGREEEGRILAAWGGRVAAPAAIGQLPIGFWLVLVMPRSDQQTIMGHDTLATLAFSAAFLLALWLMHVLVAIARGKYPPARWRMATALLIAVMCAMAIAGEAIHVAAVARRIVLGS